MSSLLFVPASEPRRFEKACSLPCRAIVVDLEDAVAPQSKRQARDRLATYALRAKEGGRALIVRINGVRTPWWEDDVRAAVEAGIGQLLVPKCEEVEELAALDALLTVDEKRTHRASAVSVIALIESARGLARVELLLAASPRVRSATLGFADLCADLQLDWDTAFVETPPLFTAERLRLTVLSRAAGIEPPWDSVYLRLDDSDRFARDVRLGRRIGCQGKFVIHPSQLAIVNATYAAAPSSRAHAARLLAAYEAALAEGRGAVTVDGLLVDEPVAARARALLADTDS